MASLFPQLLSLDQVSREQRPNDKGPLRVDLKDEADRLDEAKLAVWRALVYERDKYRCRCCGRKVSRTIALRSDRAEAHHLDGRANLTLRYDRRNGATLCLSPCHRRVTGMVNDKLVIVGTRHFRIDGVCYVNANFPIRFQEAK